MTRRPYLLDMLPDRAAVAAWAYLYRGRVKNCAPLYSQAPLRHARHIRMDLLQGDVISDCIAFTGVHEPGLTRRVVELARAGGTMVEIGANLGYFSLLWAGLRDDNRCVAVEASPRNVSLLERNIAANGLGARVQLIPYAAGRSAGCVRFDPGPLDQTGWGGFAPEGAPGIDVDVVRVDSIVPRTTRIALLKVDIEGADAWALEGCDALLKSGAVGEVWFEQNKPRMEALGIPVDAAQTYLRSVGYKATPQGDQDAPLVEWSAVPERSGAPAHA